MVCITPCHHPYLEGCLYLKILFLFYSNVSQEFIVHCCSYNCKEQYPHVFEWFFLFFFVIYILFCFFPSQIIMSLLIVLSVVDVINVFGDKSGNTDELLKADVFAPVVVILTLVRYFKYTFCVFGICPYLTLWLMFCCVFLSRINVRSYSRNVLFSHSFYQYLVFFSEYDTFICVFSYNVSLEFEWDWIFLWIFVFLNKFA